MPAARSSVRAICVRALVATRERVHIGPPLPAARMQRVMCVDDSRQSLTRSSWAFFASVCIVYTYQPGVFKHHPPSPSSTEMCAPHDKTHVVSLRAVYNPLPRVTLVVSAGHARTKLNLSRKSRGCLWGWHRFRKVARPPFPCHGIFKPTPSCGAFLWRVPQSKGEYFCFINN